MTTFAQTLDGIEARLKTLTPQGLRVYDIIPEMVDPSHVAAIILPPTVPDYWDDLSGGGLVQVRFPVLLLASTAVARFQLRLVPFIEKTGPVSIFALVQTDRTLGGLNVDAKVTNVEDFDVTQVGLMKCYGRTVNIDATVSS